MSVKLNSKIFDKSARIQAISNLISKSAKDFKVLTKQRMVLSPHTGRQYGKKRGATFRRAHRASARGERPSPDTLTLVNAISDKRISDLHSRVYVAERVNPVNGQVATKYGEILQNKLGRPIMSDNDASEANVKLAVDANAALKTLL